MATSDGPGALSASTAERTLAQALDDYVTQTWAVAAAEVQKLIHDPLELLTRAVQPVLWLMLFGEVMARVHGVAPGNLPYLDYLAAGNRRFLWTAFLLLPLALVCDILDGYVARLDRKRQSTLGADLDSLADVISFGVAPATLGFTLGLRGGWDMALLTYFVICGVSRLARFNVTASALADAETGKVKYFALSSGTSESASKHIPVTQDMIRSTKKVGFKQFYSMTNFRIPSGTFEKGVLMLGGSTSLMTSSVASRGSPTLRPPMA